MDRELWITVFSAVKLAARRIKSAGRRPVFPDWLIVAMYLWSVWHDRPMCWACSRSHYSSLFRPRKLPSVSQFTRRVKSDTVCAILQAVHDQFAMRGVMIDAGFIDGKPLLVSPVSKDRQARRGKISGGFAKGYKLHAMVNDRRRIVVWSVMGLNIAEQSVAAELFSQLPPLSADGLIMMDSNYDSAPLHKLSQSLGLCQINPLKGQDRVGENGHHPVTLRQMGESRRNLVHLWDTRPDLMRFVLKARDEIERVFGVLVCSAGGLATLPSWVRTLDRVRRWTGGKIVFYNARLSVQEKLRKVPKQPPSLAAA